MSDSEPKEQKPKFTPDPTKGWYSPPSEPPRKLHEGDDEPEQDITQFGAAAIRCANMEEELAVLLKQVAFKDDWQIEPSKGVVLEKVNSSFENYISIKSRDEKIIGINGISEGAEIGFIVGIPQPGLDTDKRLEIGMHTDESTLAAFQANAKKYPDFAQQFTRTTYIFTSSGGYRKISTVPLFSLAGNPIPIGAHRVEQYKSEMTPGDFELAGKVLQILINKLKPEEKPEE